MSAHSLTGARGRPAKRARKPLRQGSLDGLCGVYAIINAVQCVRPKVSKAMAQRLFQVLVQVLAADDQVKLGKPGRVVYRGITRATLAKLFGTARRHLAAKHGIAFVVARLPGRPCPDRPWKIAELTSRLSAHLSEGGVAVIALRGCMAHWTVLVAVTPKQFRMRDSDGLRTIRRDECVVELDRGMISILPVDVFLISKGAVEQRPHFAALPSRHRRATSRRWRRAR
jgi:hypothetical protein